MNTHIHTYTHHTPEPDNPATREQQWQSGNPATTATMATWQLGNLATTATWQPGHPRYAGCGSSLALPRLLVPP